MISYYKSTTPHSPRSNQWGQPGDELASYEVDTRDLIEMASRELKLVLEFISVLGNSYMTENTLSKSKEQAGENQFQ